ncbi:hypothetical protein LIER_01268 [Lithospermum erythrorhizon]|uniref:Uncharacterized protein n=1 Tax=Lithospermum erythrorhizon TaxID=34254 RepID=A0AAV3NK96_LITER
MFASQLLRILQTLPADTKYEPRDIDEGELKVRATEKHYKEADFLAFNTKESLHSKDRVEVADPLALHTRKIDGFTNAPKLEYSNSVIRVSSNQDDPSEDLYHLNRIEKDADALTSDEEDTNELWNTPELECSLVMDEYANCNEHESQVSSGPFVTSESFHADKNVCTDKTVLDYELPELMVCYKESNYHVVKDIGVDDGIPVEDKVLIDGQYGTSVGQPISLQSNEHGTNGLPGGLDFELLIQDESKASPNLDAEKHQPKEENGIMTSIINESNILSVEEDKRGPNPEIAIHNCGKNATNKKENDRLFEQSIITSVLPLKKFGTRSFLRSFMDSFDDNQGDIVQHLNQASLQILGVESEAEDSDQDSTENELIYNSKVENGTITFDFCPSEPTAADNNEMNDQVIEKSLKEKLVLNHDDPNSNNHLAGLVVQHADIEANHQESALDHGFRNASNPFVVSEVQGLEMDGCSVNFHHEDLLDNEEGHPNNPFVSVEVQSNTTDVSTAETCPTTIANQKKDIFNPFSFSVIETDEITEPPEFVEGNNSSNPFVATEVQNAKTDNISESNDQQRALSSNIVHTSNPFESSEVQSSVILGSIEKNEQPPEFKDQKGNLNNPFAISEIENAEISRTSPNVNTEIVHVESFEASFSAVLGRVPDSGQITSSSSTSVRSDSSSTSLRSFAFPVLQCEWNDSPEKFGKGAKRDLPKQRGRWKQGAWRAHVLCCSGRFTGQ